MEITNELIAIYAEGNATQDEKEIVRKYLMENPQQLETVMMVMDGHFDLALDSEEIDASGNSSKGKHSFQDIAMSAAAFAPQMEIVSSNVTSNRNFQRKSFDTCLNELVSEIF